MVSSVTLERVSKSIAELRPLNTVALRVIQLAESDASARELATAISGSPVLTAKMLRLANSAYYGSPNRVSTVRQAVVRVGFNAARSAAVAVCLLEALPGGSRINQEEFWQFSLSVAMLAELIARAERAPGDEAFTAGTLHNIGLLALDQYLPEVLAAVMAHAQERRVTLEQAERRCVGFTHAELGGALARRWGFPPDLTEAVALHQSPHEALRQPHSLAAFVLRGRKLLRAHGVSDGVEQPNKVDPPLEWSIPPLSVALRQAGGVAGLMDRAQTFMDSAQ